MDQRLFALCLSAVLLLSGCKPQAPVFLPVTGGKAISAPAQIEMARKNVVHYVVSSTRLASMPEDTDWQLDAQQPSDNQYSFHHGDWLIVILLTDNKNGNKQVVILNHPEKAAWTGYITPAGDVVDTYYIR